MVRTTLGVSGVRTPGVPGTLSVSGAPPFGGFLSGLPTLLINGLYIDAR